MMMFRSASEGGAEAFLDEIHDAVFSGMERVGQLTEEEWKDRLAVDVEYETGPRGGKVVIRSKPGESPRRESHDLQESIQAQTESDANLIITTVDTDVDYGGYLQEGTFEILPRPHAPDLDQFTERLLNAIVIAIEGD